MTRKAINSCRAASPHISRRWKQHDGGDEQPHGAEPDSAISQRHRDRVATPKEVITQVCVVDTPRSPPIAGTFGDRVSSTF
jgi:hypothetical protein